MRHSGAIVEAGTSAVAPAYGARGRYRLPPGGSSRSGAYPRSQTKWRPKARAERSPFDRNVALCLTFAAVAVWVACGFRLGHPDRVAIAAILSAFSSVLQVVSLVGAAYFAAAVTGGGSATCAGR